RHAVLQAVQTRDAVGDGEHGADLGQLGLPGVEPLDAALQNAGYLVGIDLHGGLLNRSLGDLLAQPLQSVTDGGVEDRVTDPYDDASEDVGVDARGEHHLVPGIRTDPLAD